MSEKHQETADAELIGMAVIAFADCIEVVAANMDRANQGKAMAYASCYTPDIQALRSVLAERGVFVR